MTDCKRCGQAGVNDHPHCPKCEDELLAAGVCKWCGVQPRKPRVTRAARQSHYCPACQTAAANSAVSPERPTPAYRGPDARENTRETRSGG